MWFKTRVGFVALKEPAEILVAKNAKVNTWSIYVNLKVGTEETTKNIFCQRTGKRNPFVYLAFFQDGPNVNKAISEAMTQIELAMRSKADFCDFSQIGDSQAWTKAWQQIQWPKN